MRCIAKFDTEDQGRKFFLLLESQGIDSQISRENEQFEIWVKIEDQLPQARQLYEDFLAGKEAPTEKIKSEKEGVPHPPKPLPEKGVQINLAPLTRFSIFICTIIFFVAIYQQSLMKEVKGALFPRFTPIEKQLMYDYPVALASAQALTETYNVAKETDVATLPPEAHQLIQNIQNNPPWEGFYTVFLNWGNRDKLLYQPKLFGDILQGEVWRLFTPAILHANFLHILFNMLWVWMLGKMIERNMALLTYLAFIVITAVVTNTLQYLMTGPFFMGFSGVVSAMAGYIWVRKKRAPWEIYPIDFGTLIFLWVFIFGMLALQVVAFFLEILHIVSFPLNIANTAHVSGVVLGMMFGRVFKRKL